MSNVSPYNSVKNYENRSTNVQVLSKNKVGTFTRDILQRGYQ